MFLCIHVGKWTLIAPLVGEFDVFLHVSWHNAVWGPEGEEVTGQGLSKQLVKSATTSDGEGEPSRNTVREKLKPLSLFYICYFFSVAFWQQWVFRGYQGDGYAC